MLREKYMQHPVPISKLSSYPRLPRVLESVESELEIRDDSE